MKQTPRRSRNGYFPRRPGCAAPIVVRVSQRIRFSDVDPMGVLWHGRYAKLLEAANEEIGRRCGLGYEDFRRARLAAPIVQLHVDYFAPLMLGEEASITGRLLWSEGARIDIEYEIHKASGELAATGYTVQMFVDEEGVPLLAPPPIQEACRRRWIAGEFE